jgi:hypothetical protein
MQGRNKVESREARQFEVGKHQIERFTAGPLQACITARAMRHRVSAAAQNALKARRNGGVVFYKKNS